MPACARPGVYVRGQTHDAAVLVRRHLPGFLARLEEAKLLPTLPSDGDPQEFTISSGGSEFLTITGITSATPNIKTATTTDPQAFLKLVLTATQGTSGNALRSSKSPTAPPPSSSPPAAPEPVANLPARAYAPLMPRGPTCHVDAS